MTPNTLKRLRSILKLIPISATILLRKTVNKLTPDNDDIGETEDETVNLLTPPRAAASPETVTNVTPDDDVTGEENKATVTNVPPRAAGLVYLGRQG